VFKKHEFKIENIKSWINVQNYPFSESIFKIPRNLKSRSNRCMIFLSYFTWIQLFFKFIHICKPKQVSGIISQRDLNVIIQHP